MNWFYFHPEIKMLSNVNCFHTTKNKTTSFCCCHFYKNFNYETIQSVSPNSGNYVYRIHFMVKTTVYVTNTEEGGAAQTLVAFGNFITVNFPLSAQLWKYKNGGRCNGIGERLPDSGARRRESTQIHIHQIFLRPKTSTCALRMRNIQKYKLCSLAAVVGMSHRKSLPTPFIVCFFQMCIIFLKKSCWKLIGKKEWFGEKGSNIRFSFLHVLRRLRRTGRREQGREEMKAEDCWEMAFMEITIRRRDGRETLFRYMYMYFAYVRMYVDESFWDGYHNLDVFFRTKSTKKVANFTAITYYWNFLILNASWVFSAVTP